MERALEFLRGWPLEIACPLLHQEERWLSEPDYLCGSDQERCDELLGAWADQTTPVVWCGRGGYGATRLLSLLDKAPRLEGLTPTRMLGYSDITALFAFIHCRALPIECVHGPVLTEIPDHPTPDVIDKALRGEPCAVPLGEPTSETRDFHGTLWGGNLAVLASLCGTPWLPRLCDGGAIMLEDIDEAPYRLDRFITQLHDNRFFEGARGVLLGQFTRCGPNETGLRTVQRRLRELAVPVLGRVPVGHEAMHLPLFLGRSYRFDQASQSLLPEAKRPTPPSCREAAAPGLATP